MSLTQSISIHPGPRRVQHGSESSIDRRERFNTQPKTAPPSSPLSHSPNITEQPPNINRVDSNTTTWYLILPTALSNLSKPLQLPPNTPPTPQKCPPSPPTPSSTPSSAPPSSKSSAPPATTPHAPRSSTPSPTSRRATSSTSANSPRCTPRTTTRRPCSRRRPASSTCAWLCSARARSSPSASRRSKTFSAPRTCAGRRSSWRGRRGR